MQTDNQILADARELKVLLHKFQGNRVDSVAPNVVYYVDGPRFQGAENQLLFWRSCEYAGRLVATDLKSMFSFEFTMEGFATLLREPWTEDRARRVIVSRRDPEVLALRE